MPGWIRKRICHVSWGWSDKDKTNFGQVSEKQVRAFYDAIRMGLRPRLPRITSKTLIDHFLGRIIIYFCADPRFDTPEVIVCIDIDCHERGTYQGALACVEWLRKNGFPGLFYCRSTSLRGIHAYLRIGTAGCNALALDHAILKLQAWLRYQLQLQKWDIEGIEVKGRPPIITWGAGSYEVAHYKGGTLARA